MIKDFFAYPSNCHCECDKSSGVGEYLDYKNYKCRKKLFVKLVEECSENVDGKEIDPNKTIKRIFNSCTLYFFLCS